MNEIIDGAKRKPLKTAGIAFVLLFWIFTPFIVQRYLSYSAINISLGITAVYFVVWKLYESKEKFGSR